MSVTITKFERWGPGLLCMEWSSSLGAGTTFYIYVDGVLSETTKQTRKMFSAAAGETIQIEVLDDAGASPEKAFPGRLFFQWESVASAARYRIEEWTGAAWTTRRTVYATTEPVIQHMTDVLDDATTHRWRIVPIGTNGQDGQAREFSAFVVRRPDVPSTDGAYDDGTGRVTLSAA